MTDRFSITLLSITLRRLLACVALAAMLGCGGEPGRPSLLVYCAAVAREPMEAIAAEYEAEHGVRVELQFGGSNTLLGQATLSGLGDLFLPADALYVDLARQDGIVLGSTPVASSLPVIVASPAVAERIAKPRDLLRDDLRLALADPDAAAIGGDTKRLFETRRMWPEVKRAVETRGVFAPTVTGVANAIEIGGADAGVVWDVIAKRRRGLQVVELSGFRTEDDRAFLELAVLKSTRRAPAARAFADYVAAEGAAEFTAHGFGPPEATP